MTPDATPLVLLVHLWLHDGQEAALESFEETVVALLRRHGGVIERVIRPLPTPDADLPFEVHVVRFPDRPSFERYRADPEVTSLAERRAAIVRRTELLFCAEGPRYGR